MYDEETLLELYDAAELGSAKHFTLASDFHDSFGYWPHDEGMCKCAKCNEMPDELFPFSAEE